MTQLAFITGASSGIGQALAWEFYHAGYAVALVARNQAAMQQWVAERGLQPTRCAIYAADVSQPESIQAAAQRCLENQGLPDVVIANAGISIGMDSAIAADLNTMARIFATNNLGLAASFQPFIAPMRSRGHGHLVGIASVAGIRGLPGHGAYCGSKAAVIAYCESLRGELRGSGVQVQTIAPGFIDTPMTRDNPYPMPFLMPVADFARAARHAIESGAGYRVIPWQMGWVAKLLRIMPNALFDAAFAGRGRKPRQPQ